MARIDLETLLGEAAWLARVARGVAGAEADAADAVQDAWVAALRSPPDDDRPARPWLRRVVQNAVRMRRRAEARRAVHEEAFEGGRDAAPTPDELLERAELERRLAEAVIALDEPYRSTVMLRYREGLTAERIAEIQGVPAGTVRWRLKTALDRLRADLADARETRAWRAMVAPAAIASAQRVALLGGIAMSTKTKVALVIAALLLLLGGVALIVVLRGGAPPAHESTSPARGVVRRLATPGGPGSDPARVAVALMADASMPARRIAGRVVDGDAPAAGATVQLVLAGVPVLVAEVTADGQGAFDLGEHAAAPYRVIASAPDRAPDQVAIDLRRSQPVDALLLALTGCDHVVTGTVQDGEGTPIAHARIAPELDDWPAVETGADGRYRLCLGFGSASLLYRADGYNGVLVDVGSEGPVTRDVVLIPEVVVSGRVVRPDGEPVAGAWVSLQPNPFGAERSAPVHVLSGADGRFSASGVSAGRNLVSARADRWATPRAVEIVATPDDPIAELVVVVEPNVHLAGVVVDRTGAPVAGAGLQLRIANKIEAGTVAITGPDGRFAIASVPPVDLALVVEGHTVVTPRIVRAGSDVRIEVARLATVRGRVLRAGRPVAGATIECLDRPRTGADGRYECAGLMAGRFELAALDPTSWGLVTLELAPGETREVDLELSYSAMICGEVVDAAGAPVPNASARFVQPTGDEGTGVTDEHGRFCARRLSGGGDYAATVTIGGVQVPAATPFPVVKVEGANERVDGIRLAIDHQRGAIAGRVVDSSGAPVADARVVAEPAGSPPSVVARYHVAPAATTAADGRFRLDGLTRGAYALVARGADGGLVSARAATGTDDVELTLDPAGRIDGRLVGFRSPPRVVAIAEGGALPPLDAQLDGDTFRITAVPPGRYFLTAVTGPESDTDVVDVAPGATATTTMASRGSGVVVGRVIDHATGAPVAGCLCDTASRAGTQLGVQYYSTDSRTVCDATGGFRIDPAPAGEIAVICDAARTSRGFRAVTLPRDGVLEVDVPVVALAAGAGDPGMYVEPVEHRVRDLVPDGPAATAGIQVGDIITTIDTTDVSRLSPQGIRALILQRPANTAAQLTLRRGDRTLTVSLTP